MMTVYHWLVANGLWRDMVSAAILVPLMRLMATRPLKRIESAVETIRVEAHELRDLERIEREQREDA
jgi:hypothetical protein